MTALSTETGLPRDRVVINPVINFTSGIDDPQSLCDDWAAAMDAWLTTTYRTEINVRAYDVAKKPHGPAAASKILNPGIYKVSGQPRELALCLSFFSEYNVKRRRGRLYLPVFLLGENVLGARPTQAARDRVAALAQSLQDLGPVDADWSVYSGVDGTARKVTNWFVDDEWDIQRSRGLRSTTRSSGVTGE